MMGEAMIHPNMRFRALTPLRLVAATGLAASVCLIAPQTVSAQTTLQTPTNFGTTPAPLNGKPNDACGFSAPYGYIGADDITFSAVSTGPAGVGLSAEFLIVPSNGSQTLDLTTSAVSGSPARILVPRTDFTDGVTYTWQVRTTDSSGDVSPYTRACHFISDQTQPPQPTVSSATFNSTTSPVAGTLGTFTFSVTGPDASSVVGFDFGLNNAVGLGSPFVSVGPDGTATTPPLRSTKPGPNFITVQTVDHGGNVSQPVTYTFDLRTPPPAADKDMNGDGIPDLLTVGDTPGLGPGLWLATGKAKNSVAAEIGTLNKPATNIGVNGDGVGSPNGPSQFDGAQVITGQFFAQGFNDVLVYYPSGDEAGFGMFLHSSGDGSALTADGIFAGFADNANFDNPLQVVNAYASIYGTGAPDLLAISGDPVNGFYLAYYSDEGGFANNTFTVNTPTPDGTADWNKWTLATASDSGGTGMFLWNESTGALYLWAGVTFADNGNGTGTISYTQYKISSDFNRGQSLSTLEAADFDGDGVPDLWTVTPSGVATAYLVSSLSATGTAKITAGQPQQLP
jgi:hypothetical protein